MSERTSKKPGIADYVAARRKHKDCFLDEIDRLIDWKPIEKVLRQKLKRVANAVGNPADPPLLMFKIRNRSISPFLRRLSFLSWFIPQEDDHGSSRDVFRESGVLV